ncbi:hypothetical protein [Streptomyces sp. GQFP]|uniref:hypothetical protein n=1 Tax=Streptomyces sp. GQFP TaxID=2907545 RepID=UPI001F2E8E90|nr:hypothetical protein [Streptomyces sp. GQFP]UIX35716.1 hypothetical protein LUX31_34255 [Streptomyces sp. GQFP]
MDAITVRSLTMVRIRPVCTTPLTAARHSTPEGAHDPAMGAVLAAGLLLIAVPMTAVALRTPSPSRALTLTTVKATEQYRPVA